MIYPKLVEKLREVSESVVLSKKTHIAYQGEIPRYGYYLLDGAVKAYVIGSDGSEMIADIFARNSLLPVAWLNRTAPTAIFYYETLNEVRALRFNRQNFESLVADDEEVKSDYMRYMANSQTSLLFRNAGLCQSNAEYKVCHALYFLIFRYGIQRTDGKFMIPVPLTHETIANFIGQSRENTAKTIKKLSDESLFEYESKTYTVDLSKLENYLGERSFRELISQPNLGLQ